MKSTKSNCIFLPLPRSSSKVRLFCFSYAGGGASAFYSWASLFSETVEVGAVQLPGRENRFREALLTDPHVLTSQIVDALSDFDSKPFAFFGHSLGAKIAFLVALELGKRGRPGPEFLFVSGSRAPHLPPREEPIHNLPLDEFIEAVLKYGGMPQKILADKEILDLYVPILRADMALNDTIEMDKSCRLSCGITAFGGLGDPWVTQSDIESWSTHTEGPFTMQMLDGDHFFINHHKDAIVRSISAQIAVESSRSPF